MPVGAYAACREIMRQVAPTGPIYQAGTLSGNPVAMAAGLTQLQILNEHPMYYTAMERKAQAMAHELCESAKLHGLPLTVNQCGPLLCPYFTSEPVHTFTDTQQSDLEQFRNYFHGMLDRGIYLAPSQFEAVFINASHSDEDIAAACEAADAVFTSLSKNHGV